MAKGIFFFNLSLLGGVLVVGVYQVPQPWRGIVVVWLVFALTVGAFVLRLLRHHYEYKALQLSKGTPNPPARSKRRRRKPKPQGLQIVLSERAGGRQVL